MVDLSLIKFIEKSIKPTADQTLSINHLLICSGQALPRPQAQSKELAGADQTNLGLAHS